MKKTHTHTHTQSALVRAKVAMAQSNITHSRSVLTILELGQHAVLVPPRIEHDLQLRPHGAQVPHLRQRKTRARPGRVGGSAIQLDLTTVHVKLLVRSKKTEFNQKKQKRLRPICAKKKPEYCIVTSNSV